MLDFEYFNRRKEVQTALTNRVNTVCMDGIRHADRKNQRSPFSEVVWLVPTELNKRGDYSKALPAVSKDISVGGLSLVHNRPLTSDHVIAILPGANGPTFLRCEVEHCTRLGYGFFQIGLRPERVLQAKHQEQIDWEKRCEEFDDTPAAAPPN